MLAFMFALDYARKELAAERLGFSRGGVLGHLPPSAANREAPHATYGLLATSLELVCPLLEAGRYSLQSIEQL